MSCMSPYRLIIRLCPRDDGKHMVQCEVRRRNDLIVGSQRGETMDIALSWILCHRIQLLLRHCTLPTIPYELKRGGHQFHMAPLQFNEVKTLSESVPWQDSSLTVSLLANSTEKGELRKNILDFQGDQRLEKWLQISGRHPVSLGGNFQL